MRQFIDLRLAKEATQRSDAGITLASHANAATSISHGPELEYPEAPSVTSDASLPEIGRQFSGKHHTTVLHSVDKIENQRKTDKDLNRMLNKLTEMLSS